MADVKWIKIVTNIFDDEKIRYIETLPNGDETIVIWFRILCLAGKSNSSGLLMMTDRIAYTDDMLSSIFNRDIKSIQLALNTFLKLGMIEMIEDKIYISNWDKHQSLEKLEQKKLYDREYQKKKREGVLLENCNTIVRQSYDNRTTIVEENNDNRSLDIELELDKEEEKDKDNKKNYGTMNNVRLTDKEYAELSKLNLLNEIDTLSVYIASKGKKYKSHYATILNWDRKKKSELKDKRESGRVADLPEHHLKGYEEPSNNVEINRSELIRKIKGEVK